MIIIFGFRTASAVLATLAFQCARCGHQAAQRVVEIRRKFTLFFIPLFTVSTKRFLVCVACGSTTPLTKEQADQMVQAASRPVYAPWGEPSAAPAGSPALPSPPGPSSWPPSPN
jgi:transcription elongation factor Elf1